MANINATGDAVKTITAKFHSAKRHGRIARSQKLRIACRHRGGDPNEYELICLGAGNHRLPIRPVPFRQLITDSTPLPPMAGPLAHK